MTDLNLRGLAKRFGRLSAVDDLTFDVSSGKVTGFLGPNGAGKTTTLRILLGLVRQSAGEALFDGRSYQALPHPRATVGAVLDASGFHPGRRGRDYLRILARTAGVGPARVPEVLDLVGLADAGDRRIGGYSLGMRQRLGLAAALLADPEVLILDEPANGLDPEGMAWLRGLMRGLADEGRTILVSSHVLSEVAQVADHVVIVSRGRLRFAGTLSDLGGQVVSVGTSEPERLRAALAGSGLDVTVTGAGTLAVGGANAEEVSRVAMRANVVLSSLTEAGSRLEEAFLELTRSSDAPVAARQGGGDLPC
jgi:ABC-2 type transport system ATP-binding protein